MTKSNDALIASEISDARGSSRRLVWSMIAALVIAGILRVMLADYSPWYDEFYSLSFASNPLGDLWGPPAIQETNPPLFYTLLGFWKELGARSVVELRILPIMAGLISIGLTGFVVAKWFGKRAGLIAILLMAMSPQHIFYSQLLRGFLFALDGVLISIFGLLMIVNRRQRRDDLFGWACHAAGCSIAIYFHTTMFLWPAISAAGLLVFYGRQLWAERVRLVIGLAAANAAILIVTSWWLWVTYLQLRWGGQSIAWMKPLSFTEYLNLLMRTCFFTFDYQERDVLATSFFAVLAIGSAIALWRDRNVRFIAILAVIAVVTFGVAGALKPILLQRTVYWMSIFPVLLIAAGLGSLRSASLRWAMAALCVAILAVNLVRTAPSFEREDWRAMVSTLARDSRAVVLVQGLGIGMSVKQACLLQLYAPCPFPVVDLPPKFEQGAPGQTVEEAKWREVRQGIARDSNIYVVNYHGKAPLKSLKIVQPNARGDDEGQFFEGPFPAGMIKAGQP